MKILYQAPNRSFHDQVLELTRWDRVKLMFGATIEKGPWIAKGNRVTLRGELYEISHDSFAKRQCAVLR